MALDPISAIAEGIGGIFQGGGAAIAATQEANTDDICGKKPGIFAKKDKKEAYQQCMANASAARINALNAQAEATKRASETKATEETNRKWVVPVVVGVISIALIVTIVWAVKRKSKK